jgi:hypothetical protein
MQRHTAAAAATTTTTTIATTTTTTTVATAAAVSTAATSPGALGLGCLAAEAFSLARKHIHAALRALPVARSDVAWQ